CASGDPGGNYAEQYFG
nr:T-cell receptor V region beta-chain, TCR V beta {colony 4-2} [mice, NOD, intrathyroidal T cells, Peptide Partial, 16 aa] [Mus sp.]